MKITYLGHSCFLIEGNEEKLLIDPFIEKDVGADFILVTHGHGDHIGKTVKLAKRHNSSVIAIYELSLWFGKKGVNAIGMNIGGSYKTKEFKITMVNAQHSSTIVEDTLIPAGNPTGFIISDGKKTIYHAGDTGVFMDMKIYGELYNIDVALLPIGDLFTMGGKEAAYATKLINPKIVIPMHYKTFPLIKQDTSEFEEELKKLGLYEKLKVLEIGESLEI